MYITIVSYDITIEGDFVSDYIMPHQPDEYRMTTGSLDPCSVRYLKRLSYDSLKKEHHVTIIWSSPDGNVRRETMDIKVYYIAIDTDLKDPTLQISATSAHNVVLHIAITQGDTSYVDCAERIVTAD